MPRRKGGGGPLYWSLPKGLQKSLTREKEEERKKTVPSAVGESPRQKKATFKPRGEEKKKRRRGGVLAGGEGGVFTAIKG